MVARGMRHGVGARGARVASPKQVRGVSLVEVLVAVVLLAVGLLGLAGLQLRGIQVNQGSQWRTMAASMAEDLADRMRAEQDVNSAGGTGPAIGSFLGSFTPANTNADASMQNWLQVSLGQLPSGSVPTAIAPPCGAALPCAVVTALGGAPNPVQIDIYWNDTHTTNATSLAPVGTTTGTVGAYHVVTIL